jgi:putative glycosyltransferase (TIGR04372 family)
MKLLRALLLIPAALVVIGVRVLDRFGVNIKFSNFLSPRIGHLVGNTEVYLCERDLGMHSGIHIWTHYGPIASEQIALMWKRVMRIWPARFTALVILINKCFPGWEKHEIGTNTLDRDPLNLLEKCSVHLRFTGDEIDRGEATLKELGLPAGAQWVCLMVRDAAYLPQLGYHSYRDADVDDYEEAAMMLAERGYYVFRMGKKVAKPFAAKHPRIRDFATDGTYSDFMGVYLGAYCAFTVTTSTGWDAIPQAFRRPMCYTNFAPFEYLNTWLPHSLAIWKHHIKDGKRISVAEIVKSGAGKFMRADEFENAGITLEDNSPQEIVEVVREMADMIEGRFYPKPQREFWDAFPKSELHGAIRLRIGSSFLEESRGYDAGREKDSGSDTGARRLQAGAV